MAAVAVGIIAMILGIVFEKMNVTFPGRLGVQRRRQRESAGAGDASFLAANDKQGLRRRVRACLVARLALLSGPAYKDVYG
jgi:hypothetical protein